MSPAPALYDAWWYYSVELEPGRIVRGQYDPQLPMLPRLAVRGADAAGAACLDLGTMEGLIPTLWARQGAARVVAADAVDHCKSKLAAVQAAYGVQFEFARVGLMYDLSRKLPGFGGFDLINLSGLLYHVFSPPHVLAGARPLLKRGGLMVVSTNVVNRRDYTAEWNAGGRLQPELNTFWYLSIPTFEDMLRSFGLRPIDCLYAPHAASGLVADPGHGLDTGYLSVVCRADDAQPADRWAQGARRASWEFKGLYDAETAAAQPASDIAYASATLGDGGGAEGLDLFAAANDPRRQVLRAQTLSDGHTLRLADRN